MSDGTGMPPAVENPSDDDLKALLAKRQHAKPNRWTWILLALIAVSLGFAMGACTQRQVSSFTAPMQEPSIASDPAGAIGGQPGATPPGVTIGTVTEIVDGSIVLTTPDGTRVTVLVPEGTPVTTAVEVPLAEIPLGATVTVRGASADDGTVTAESVSEGALRPGPPGTAP